MAEKCPEEIIARLSKEISVLTGKLFSASVGEQAWIKEEIARLSAQMSSAARDAARAALENNRPPSENDFWDLGAPKARIYKKPDFDGHTISTTEVRDDSEYDPALTAQSERIPSRDSRQGGTSPRRTVTASYRRNMPTGGNYGGFHGNTVKNESKILCQYSPGGTLIHSITVRSWESGAELYLRFTSDAMNSHKSSSRLDPDTEAEPVPFMSYVPQYAHMGSRQTDYYRWLRENFRRGKYPVCDLGYIQLYIYEIFNLPHVIPPEDGARIIASLWLAYRSQHPRLDGYLCEWFADYCMVNKCSLPRELDSIIPLIVPKSQFKEFYLDPVATRAMEGPDERSLESLGRAVIEVSSDYDYTSSRYYSDGREAFDTHIPMAVGLAVRSELIKKSPPFSLDRIYKMTRDSYSGAIVSSSVKKRVDLEFSSFTRRADVRDAVTAIVKYSENKVRVLLGIKSKLRVEDISKTAEEAIDEYFAPLLPKSASTLPEDRFMPRDYLKLYESEECGFDFGKAAEIERLSWVNTERLTGEELVEWAEEYSPDTAVVLEGEISDLEKLPDGREVNDAPPLQGSGESATEICDPIIRDGAAAALEGRFREYCRNSSLYDGEAADRINTLFLDIVGDIVLIDRGSGYEIIEDYREEVENWLQMQ